MAWTTPVNLATGDKVTDAIWNLQVIDNLLYLYGVFYGSENYLCFKDEKADGTSGGTFTSGAWRTRDLTIEQADSNNLGSLAANQITLAAGTYHVRWSCPAYNVNMHFSRLYNITASALIFNGQMSKSAANAETASIGMGRFTLAVTSVLELQHICETTVATNGFGLGYALGGANPTNVYSMIEFYKVPA